MRDDKIDRKLQEFKLRDKFSEDAWTSRGLSSPPPALSDFLNSYFDELAYELRQNIKYDAALSRKSLLAGLKDLKDTDFDLKTRDFIVDYFLELSKITNTDIRSELIIWMYGDDVREMLSSRTPL